MIAKLTGRIDYIGEDFLILDVHGVGYRVFCSAKALSQLSVGQEGVSLFTDTQVREDAIRLFGLQSMEEKEWYDKLVTVQGVGAKVALAILSVFSPQELSLAFAAQDAKALTRAAGVGPKLAQRIVSELKGKTPLCLGGSTSVSTSVPNSPANEAISALTHLGYGQTEVAVLVSGLVAKTPDATVEVLINTTLKELGKRKF